MGLSGVFFFFKAEGGIGDDLVTGVQTCALPICRTATYSPLAYERIQLDGLHARRSFEIRGIDSTQTLHSDTDAAVLPGNTAPWLFSRTQYADRKSTRLNSSHQIISYAVFCLKKKKNNC